jgi:hypothetical protein
MSTNRFLSLINGVQSWFTAINTSSGISDANKIIATNSIGEISPSFLPKIFNRIEVYSDFLGGFGDFNAFFTGTNSTVRTQLSGVSSSSADDIQGILFVSTGTVNTGRASVGFPTAALHLSSNVYKRVTFWAIQRLELLSDSVNRFITIVGLSNSAVAGGTTTNGVYFRYSDNLNGGNWQCVVVINSTETIINTNVIANTTSWVKFGIDINLETRSAEFFISDLSVGTLSTNGLQSSGVYTGLVNGVFKSTGTTSRNLLIDKMYFTMF